MTSQANPETIPIRQAVSQAVNHWTRRQPGAGHTGGEVESSPASNSILRSMPRRQQFSEGQEGQLWLPYYRPFSVKASFWQSLGRLLAWINLIIGLLFAILLDKIMRRDSTEARAVHLRQTLERGGGTFVKLGQQAAMRIDLLPWEYCVELSKMLDRMVPFPTEEALKAIDRNLGRPWQEVFETFDPTPIGSASIACVYQATLKDGARVVAKVRRPGIDKLFAADLHVLDWIMDLAEYLTFFRPGFTTNLRAELRETLMEELDFRREGRFQDTFRRNAKKSGRSFFTAPKVYTALSGGDVLVQEFITGLWLWEVIAAIEGDDPRGKAMLREMNIDPLLVARRILWAAFWSMDENVFFHADPHPANILVRPDNEITFIDFGSCGSFNTAQRTALEQMVISMKNQDVESMTRSALNLMEPIPPVDLPALVKMFQEEYMRLMYTFNTPAKYTQYWERTSARQWFSLIRVARVFNIPMNLHMLRMIRATLLYDSIVLRLDNKLDRYYEYTQFMKDRAEMVKDKWRKKLRDNAGDDFFLNLEEFGNALNDLMIRTQTTLGRPLVYLGSTVDKWIYATSVVSRMAGRIILVTFMVLGFVAISAYLRGAPVSLLDGLNLIVHNVFYLLFIAAAGVINARHILFRLRERDE